MVYIMSQIISITDDYPDGLLLEKKYTFGQLANSPITTYSTTITISTTFVLIVASNRPIYDVGFVIDWGQSQSLFWKS